MTENKSPSSALELHKLYTRLLGRACDPSGLETYGKMLRDSASIEDIEEIIKLSDEYQNRQSSDPEIPGDHDSSTPIGTKSRILAYEADTHLVEDSDLRALIDRAAVELKPGSKNFNSLCLDIHWVVPDFSPGSGGHMTIFRIVRLLELKGHQNTIWIHNTGHHVFADEAYNTLVKHYTQVTAQVYQLHENCEQMYGDIIFATDWGSVSYVCSVKNFKRRFYFVQDYEPFFHPRSSKSIAAENTYREDLDCICAGPWLSEQMRRHGRWAWDFRLAVDESVYYPCSDKKTDSVFRIGFYCRQYSPRRAVELGLLAFEVLARKGVEFELHCFSNQLSFDSAPFKCVDHGLLSPPELAQLYQSCDLGIVFSSTNYSLIPQEMMACGLPVAELDSECTRMVFPREVITLLDSNPVQMADQIEGLIANPKRLAAQAQAGLRWVSGQSWESVAEQIENCIVTRLVETGFKNQDPKPSRQQSIKVSVCIPTLNGGQLLRDVITRVCEQVAPWRFEIVVVDSGSTDGTVEFLNSVPEVQLHHIEQSSFQHGRTRNLAVELSGGEYAAFLTQDALPTDRFWLYNLVSCLDHYPDAAGVFGRHLAHADADRFTHRDLKAHFQIFGNLPISVSKHLDQARWARQERDWLQVLHFFSNNNSCLRRSVWEQFPFPEVEFGEDQAWAWRIIEAGFEKLYAQHATVFHSHQYDANTMENRAFEEAVFFERQFGYVLAEDFRDAATVDALNSADRAYGELHCEDERVIQNRISNNNARVSGYFRARSAFNTDSKVSLP